MSKLRQALFRALISIGLATIGSISQADLLVASYGSNSILRFSNSGSFIGTVWTGSGAPPIGIAIGPDGALYTSNAYQSFISRLDTATQNFVPFTSGGSLTSPHQIAFGGPLKDLYSSDLWLGYGPPPTPHRFSGITGAFIQTIQLPTNVYGYGSSTGVAVDSAGSVYIGDRNTGYIYKFANESLQLLVQVNLPVEGLTIGPDGKLYVVSSFGYRILRYSLDGTPFGLGGNLADATFINDGRLVVPFNVQFDSSGMIYVTNTYASEILRYSPSGAFVDTVIAAGVGGLNLPTYMVFTPTPAAVVSDLGASVQALVAGGALLPADGTSMQSMLGVAGDKLTKGNNKGALGSLRAFANQVAAFVNSGKLTAAQGQALTTVVQGVIAELGG